MKMPWFNRKGPAKVLAIGATVFLTAAVLCAIQSVIASFHESGFDSLLIVSSIIGLIEVGIMALSLIVCTLAFLWMIASRAFRGGFQRNVLPSAVGRFHVSSRNSSKVA